MDVSHTRWLLGASAALGLLAIPPATAAAELRAGDPRLAPKGRAQAKAFAAGMGLFEQKRYARAVAEFDKAISRQPAFAAAITMRGFARIELGDYPRAIADHDETLALAPESPASWANACWVRAVAGIDLQRALDLCDKAVSLRPDAVALDSRGFAHFRRGDLPGAIRDYDAALKLEPRQASSLFMRGVVRTRSGDVAAGSADMDKADRVDRDVRSRYARFGVQP